MVSAPPPARTISTFQVQLLGSFALERDGRPVDTARWQRRVSSLFKLLAVAPGRRRTRDEIIDLFWPEAAPDAGAGNLRLLVYRLRLALSEDERQTASGPLSPVLMTQGWVSLNPAHTWNLDLDRFEQLTRGDTDDPALLEQAAALYRGEPLVEDCYEDWAGSVRERLARQWRALCLRLAGLHEARGSLDGAIGWLNRILDLDPLDEEVLQSLLAALNAAARRTEALRRFRQFERRLAEEIGVTPDPKTLALVEESEARYWQATPSQPPTTPRRPPDILPVVPSYPLPTAVPLHGRVEIMHAIGASLPTTGIDATRLVLLAAGAGMGKTRLVAEVAHQAREAGVVTLAGGCYEQEGRLPYGPIHDALLDYVQAQPPALLDAQLGDLLPDLAVIVPELRTRGGANEAAGDAESLRLRLFSTVAQALERICRERPVALLLDDLHWADDATVQLLHYLLRRHQRMRLTVIGAYRQEDVANDSLLVRLAELTGQDEALPITQLSLEPLTEEDMTALLEERLGGSCAPPLTEMLYRRSEGNPFFALQILRLLQQEGRLEQQDGVWSSGSATAGRSGDLPLPPLVRETVMRRLRHLSADAREALTLGAVLGRRFPYPALEAMWEGGEQTLFLALEAAHNAHLVAETESGYTFRHPILREVVYGQMPESRRMRLHGRAGKVLESLLRTSSGWPAGEAAVDLAWHFTQARDPERALPYTVLAGDQAEAAFARAEAERQYRTAVQLARELGDVAVEGQALEKLGSVLTILGRYDEALALLEDAVQRYATIHDAEGERRAVDQIGRVHYRQGTFEAGVTRLQQTLRSLDDGPPSPGFAQLYLTLAYLFFRAGRHDDQLEAAQRAADLADAIGDRRLQVQAWLERAYALPFTGRSSEFGPTLETVARSAEDVGDLTTLYRALCAVAGSYSANGEFERGTQTLKRALDIARGLGDPSRTAFVTSLLGRDVYWRGDWDEALRLLGRSLSIYQELGALADCMLPLYGLGAVRMGRGEWERGTEVLNEHARIARQTGDFRWLPSSTALLAEHDLLEGRPQDSRSRLQDTLDLPAFDANCVEFVAPIVAWTDLALGDAPHALKYIEKVVAQAVSEEGDLRVLVDALRAQGMVLSHLQRWEEAERSFEDALTQLQRIPYVYGKAHVLFRYGTMLTERGEPDRAIPRLEEALEIFRRLGARPYVHEVERLLLA